MLSFSLFLAAQATAAPADLLPTGSFDIPWDASKQVTMQQMKKFGWVLEKTESFSPCGMEMQYGGKLINAKSKASLSFNDKGQLIETIIWFPEGNAEYLLNLALTSLKIKYKSFVYQQKGEFDNKFLKYLKSDSSYRVSTSIIPAENVNGGILFLHYSSPGSGFEWECRRNIPGL